MKRLLLIISFAMLLLALPFTAYAADTEDNGVSITVVIPNTVKETPKPTETPKPPTNYLYPVSVWESQDNGRREIIRTYELGAGEKPEDISRESFTRDGWLYELADITKKETANADVRDHTETVTIDTNTKEMDALIKLLAPIMEFQSDDGYIGVLSLDISSIKVETAGTKSSSYTVSATREYPHLSSNDTSLIPKTITDNGRTLTLASVDWKTQNSTAVDYDQIAVSYTAVAKYTATASKTTVTGYTTTAEYHGTVSKILAGRTVYTAYFIGVPIVTATVNKPSETTPAPDATEKPTEGTSAEPTTEPTISESETETPTETKTEPTEEPEKETTESEQKKEADNNASTLLPVIIAVLLGAGIGGGFVFFYLKKLKNKEVIPNEDEENTD